MGHLECRVVYQDVDPAEVSHGYFHQVVTVLFLRKIAGNQQVLLPGCFDPAGRFLGIFMLLQVGDSNIRSLTGIYGGCSASYATVRASDQGNLAGLAANNVAQISDYLRPKMEAANL